MYYSQYFKQVNVFEKKFFEIYETRNMKKIEWFLNIRIIRDKKQQRMFLCQNSYINKLINKFNINIIKKESSFSIINYISMSKNKNTIISQEIHAY